MWDAIKQMFSDILDIIMSPVLYVIALINAPLAHIIIWLNHWADYLNDCMVDFNYAWVNPAIPPLPDFIITAGSVLNGVFPLSEFLSLVNILIQLWAWILLIKFILKLSSFGRF